MLILLLLTVLCVFAWYVVTGLFAFKKQGVDPSLITTVNILCLRNSLGFRLTFAMLLIGCLLSSFSIWPLLFMAMLTLEFALIQIVLLYIFNRSATQPILSYYLVTLLGFLELYKFSFGFSMLWLVVITLLQEYSYQRWQRNRTKLYDQWVERQVKQIDKKYRPKGKPMTEDWFHTLHIAVTENIARPKISRLAESFYFKLKRPEFISSGLMQVKADRILSDTESVEKGALIIRQILKNMPDDLMPIDKLRWLAKNYNGGLNEKAVDQYTEFLLLTYTGLVSAWQEISRD